MTDEVKDSPSAEVSTQSESAEVNETKQEQPAEGANLVAQKLINENKKYRDRARKAEHEAQEKAKLLDELQSKKLEEEGKFKEQAEFYKTKFTETESKLKEATGSYATQIVTSQVKAKAAEMGCVDYEALIKLAPLGDLTDHIDEDYNVQPTAVNEMLDMMQQKRPWLFKKVAPKIEDGTPKAKSQDIGNGAVDGKSTFDLASMIAQKTRPV